MSRRTSSRSASASRARSGRIAPALVALLAVLLPASLPSRRAAADENERPGSVFAPAVSTGQVMSCALFTTGKVRCWGWGAHGALGLGSTSSVGDDEVPTRDVNLGNAQIKAITAGYEHVCALNVAGKVICWGQNSYGELGLGHLGNVGDDDVPTELVDLGAPTVTAITAGRHHTCALLANGSVRCWGRNHFGQLGIGNTSNVGDDELPTVNVGLGVGVTATAISAGGDNTCALLSTAKVRCWGYNFYGEGGIGVSGGTDTAIGDNELPTIDAQLGANVTVTGVAVGDHHTCAMFANGNARCWGRNEYGQLGIASTATIGDDEVPTENVHINANVRSISAGAGYSCAVFASGNARCWGRNDNGQLGIASTVTIGDDEDPTTNIAFGGGVVADTISSGSLTSCAAFTTGAVRCWGRSGFGEVGIGVTGVIGDDESPTVDVPLAITVGVPDTTLPTVAITAPTAGQVYPTAPALLSGTAGDDAGVTTVYLVIYRPLAGGQYWNGIVWQPTWIAVTADSTPVNGRATSWTYLFWGAPAGLFAVAAISADGSGNFGVSPYRLFAIADLVDPTVTVTAPANGAALVSRPVTVSGSATDNVGVADVQVALYRAVGAGEWWNGTSWQAAYVTVAATVASPGATATTWTYSFNPPQPTGLYYVAAIALDTSYRYLISPFTTFTLPDVALPSAVVSAPLNGATAASPVTVSGSASDNGGISAVGVAIYRASDATYFNGSTWQAAFATVPATMGSPGANVTSWSYQFTAPSPGYYLFAALPYDLNYNYFLTAFNTVNVL